MKPNSQNVTKTLAVGIMCMGLVHIVATFSPLIAGKLALLPESAQGVFTYFSLMCGAVLLLGGWVTYTLSGKVAEHAFVRKPYLFALAVLAINSILAACFMPHNPFAWVVFALTMGLMLANVSGLK